MNVNNENKLQELSLYVNITALYNTVILTAQYT